jgi:hypothetical protein
MPVTIEEWKEHSDAINQDSEIGLRCFAARYYYVAYHSANSLIDGTMANASGGMHEQLIHTLIEGFVSESESIEYKKVGYKLRAAKTIRAKADYKLQGNFSVDDLNLLKSYVNYIIDSVGKLRKVA